MRHSILNLIELLGSDFQQLLHSILNRYPVLVVGQDVEVVDDFVESLALLAPHRHQLVFWRDFTSEDDILSVWAEERHDYEVSRTLVCCKSANLRLLLDRISNIAGWIVGVSMGSRALGLEVNDDLFAKILHVAENSAVNVGVLEIDDSQRLHFKTTKPIQSKLEVERYIVHKILTRKTQSLERIRRLLKKSVRGVAVPESFVNTLLQLDVESAKITHDMFNEEVNGFVHAARRAILILSRVRFARELGAPTKLTERNLFEAIGWNIGGIDEMIRFVQAEWHEDFSDCVNGNSVMGLSAWVDSMWGA